MNFWVCSFEMIWIRISDPRSLRSDHGRSNEPMNPLWTRIHRFIWSTMIRVISDHWSWSGSSQRNAPFVFSRVKVQRTKWHIPLPKLPWNTPPPPPPPPQQGNSICKLYIYKNSLTLRSHFVIPKTVPFLMAFTLNWKALASARNPYRVWLLLTYKNSDFDVISG